MKPRMLGGCGYRVEFWFLSHCSFESGKAGRMFKRLRRKDQGVAGAFSPTRAENWQERQPSEFPREIVLNGDVDAWKQQSSASSKADC